MILSSRADPPKMSFRKGLKSPMVQNFETSLASPSLVKQHLLSSSPLPSPSLPSILPRHGKKPKSPTLKRKMLRLVGWLAGFSILIWCAARLLHNERPPAPISYLSTDGQAYDIVGADTLPETPSPVVVTDRRGRSKWTVSIPPPLDFPLHPGDYHHICSTTMEVARHTEELRNHREPGAMKHYNYYRIDPNFMDVADAEEHGLLPGMSPRSDNLWGAMLGTADGSKDTTSEDILAKDPGRVCEKSLTYVLETSDAGLGNTLMGLWLAYGLAQKEGRAFFIEDTHWPYGSYNTYFKPPPKPSCLQPPKTQIIPCPHHARHLLVSAATISWTFGHQFNDQFEDAHKMGQERQGPMFSMMRAGYEALFELAGEDGEYLNSRLEQLNSTSFEVGIHVRHGDRHPKQFEYQRSYIPLTVYADAARDLIQQHATTLDGALDIAAETSSTTLLASDDPDVYTSSELSYAIKAQTRISLASKTELDASKGENGRKSSGVEEGLGWEGGFFHDVFWSLGLPSTIPVVDGPQPSRRRQPSLNDYSQNVPRSTDPESLTLFRTNPPPQALKLRELVGRAYLLDLAVLGQSDAVVCGFNSVACRLLAVMMGWERAIEQKMWHNVDGTWGWTGVVW